MIKIIHQHYYQPSLRIRNQLICNLFNQFDELIKYFRVSYHDELCHFFINRQIHLVCLLRLDELLFQALIFFNQEYPLMYHPHTILA